jgi:hypothetical protein
MASPAQVRVPRLFELGKQNCFYNMMQVPAKRNNRWLKYETDARSSTPSLAAN